MRKKKMIIGAVLTLCMVFGAGVFTGAATTNVEPGSAGDPLITKSYLEERIAEINGTSSSDSETISKLSSDIVALQKKVKSLESKNSSLQKELASVETQAKKWNLKKVTVKKGKTLTVKSGSEVVCYSGTATWSISGSKYVFDLTTGSYVSNKKKVYAYHSYFIRSSSYIKASKDTIVYVRGSYSIK